MRKRTHARGTKKAGLPPGSLVYIGDQPGSGGKLTVFSYNDKDCSEQSLDDVADCVARITPERTAWINVDGVDRTRLLESFGVALQLHSLTLEDILNTEQRPKIEDYGEYLYLVLKMVDVGDTPAHALNIEQLSLVLGSDYLISFQERPGDMFDPVRDRLRKSAGRIRRMGPDYLCYALIDAVVDHYFVVLDKISSRIETLEAQLFPRPRRDAVQGIHELRRDMIFLRKAVWPVRELVARLQRAESPLVRESTAVYLRDVHDHLVQITDSIDTFRDMLAGMLDMYHSATAQRTNEIMKVLTLFSSIFMPLSFITGIFGMNFRDFPALQWHWGFAGVMLIMLIIGGSMVLFFKRKRWL